MRRWGFRVLSLFIWALLLGRDWLLDIRWGEVLVKLLLILCFLNSFDPTRENSIELVRRFKLSLKDSNLSFSQISFRLEELYFFNFISFIFNILLYSHFIG